MLGRNDYLLFAGKESSRCKPATTRRDRNNANDIFGKGFRMLKDHVCAKPFNNWAVPS